MDLTISYGNAVWKSMLVYMVVLTIALYFVLRRQPQERKRRILLGIGIFLMVMFYVQRYFMLNDPRFMEMYGSGWDTKIVNLLPLHLCYASLILFIAGLALRNKALQTFCFYVSPVGATMALFVPDVYALDVSLLQPAVLMFYLSHGALAAIYWNIGFQGFAEVNRRGAAKSVAIAAALYVIMFVVNVIGQNAGIDSMNYFYSFSPEGNVLLEIFWSWIPVPGLYLFVPCVVIAAVWTTFINLCYRLLKYIKSKK